MFDYMLKKILISYHRFPTIAVDLSKALNDLGVEVELFFVDDYEFFLYKRIIKPIRKILYYSGFVNASKKIFSNSKFDYKNQITINFKKKYEEFKPDMIFVIQGAPHSNQYISTLDVLKVGWWIEPSDELNELLENSAPFDFYYCFSFLSYEKLRKYKKNVEYLNHFVDARVFKSLPGTSKKYDLLFVGNWSAWREEVLTAALEVTSNIVIYGPRWMSKSKIPRTILNQIHKGDHVDGNNLNLLYNESRIILNIARNYGSSGLNMRFTEVLSSKSFLMTDSTREISMHFSDENSLIVYSSLDDLKNLVALYLKCDDRRELIAKNGERIVRQNFSYFELAKKIIRLYNDLSTCIPIKPCR